MSIDLSYLLFVESEKYVICLQPNNEHQKPLIIDRINHEVTVAEYENPANNDITVLPITIYGILGTVNLLSGRYLMTINKCEYVGKLFDQKIYRAITISMYPFAKSNLHLTEKELEAENAYLSMINYVLSVSGFYFSHTYDLTLTRQSLSELGPESKQQTIYRRASKRFLWNNNHLQDWSNLITKAIQKSLYYKETKIDNFLTPVIFGFVAISENYSNHEFNLTYALISRRSVYRAGTRFYARGLDSNAHAANTIETEQIFTTSLGHQFSFVQLRGSVPLFWSQRPNLKYKPKVKIGSFQTALSSDNSDLPATLTQDQLSVIQRYFQNSCYLHQYGRNIVINLLDQTGMERNLCNLFTVASQSVSPDEMTFVSFDFHHECRALQWHRLSILMDRLESIIQEMGQFRLPQKTSLDGELQVGIFRTNCIDCLDRTNVVQSMLARRVLDLGLARSGFITDTTAHNNYMETVWPGFEQLFKDIWADNADICSVQYTGTNALKTDFTRSGKRTFAGMLMDGYNSMVRYYVNNFVDGFRQDSFNLFLGHYNIFKEDGLAKILPSTTNSNQSDSNIRRKFMPVVFAFATSMSVLCLLFRSDFTSENLMYFLFWSTASVLSAVTIFRFGEDFVDKPRFPME